MPLKQFYTKTLSGKSQLALNVARQMRTLCLPLGRGLCNSVAKANVYAGANVLGSQ